jgi:putative intracellular protease/amidase
MPDKSLAEMKVAILVTDGVEQAELEQPRKALITAVAQTVLLSPKAFNRGMVELFAAHRRSAQAATRT